MSIHIPTPTLLDRLDEAGIPYDLIRHRPTRTAVEEAHAVGVASRQVAKTVVLTTPTGFVRAVLPASERLDLHKARMILGTDEVELATEQALSGAYPEFELGAIPSAADLHRDRVLLDIRLCGLEDVVLEAGTHDRSIRIGTSDLIEVSDARIANLCEDVAR
jgi:Ala-tRNA(Pro) deacylase